MALFGSKDFTLTLQDAPGGTARAITVTNQVALKIIGKMMVNTPLGAEWEQQAPTGSKSVENIPLEGFWNDAANESHAMFEIKSADSAPDSVGRELVVTVGGGKTFTITGHLSEYQVQPNVGDHTGFSALLSTTGAPAWA